MDSVVRIAVIAMVHAAGMRQLNANIIVLSEIMRKVFMSKLVRDKIPEMLKEKGIRAKTRILNNDAEYLTALCDKLLEEVNEFIDVASSKEDDHIKEELADVLEVINALCKLKGYSLDAIEEIRQEKRLKRGGFEERIFSIF